jgi:hypothetical protein
MAVLELLYFFVARLTTNPAMFEAVRDAMGTASEILNMRGRTQEKMSSTDRCSM